MAKTAFYYNENGVAKEFDILKENKDGTLDIGTGSTLVVGKVQISEDGKPGTVTLDSPFKQVIVQLAAEAPKEPAAPDPKTKNK